MAINENGYLRGQVGNLVSRKVGTKNIVQTKPGRKIRQTEWSKAAADDFGYASASGALIRQAFVSTHRQLHDDKMHNRLIKHIHRVMRATARPVPGYSKIEKGNITRLIGFQFNANCHLQDYLYLDPVVSLNSKKQVCVHFPDFYPKEHLHFPKDASHVAIRAEVFSFRFRGRTYFTLGTEEIEIDLHHGQRLINEQTFIFNAPTEPYDTLLVGLTVLYLDGNGPRSFLYNSKELHPAAIIGGFNAD